MWTRHCVGTVILLLWWGERCGRVDLARTKASNEWLVVSTAFLSYVRSVMGCSSGVGWLWFTCRRRKSNNDCDPGIHCPRAEGTECCACVVWYTSPLGTPASMNANTQSSGPVRVVCRCRACLVQRRPHDLVGWNPSVVLDSALLRSFADRRH